jgi:hypothetical protein
MEIDFIVVASREIRFGWPAPESSRGRSVSDLTRAILGIRLRAAVKPGVKLLCLNQLERADSLISFVPALAANVAADHLRLADAP